ncbi:MAG: DUF1343 domain-containing protein [Armatimonadetes bacterium]|nr:DUF1343 domain-containing protein [Armatimonadota bacterium]
MPRVKPGLEVMLEQKMEIIRGQRIGLVTNHSAVTGDFTHVVDALLAVGADIRALFGPEHGVRGDVADGREFVSYLDPRTGIQVHSLYGRTRKPTPEMLAGIDLMLFDIQDVGARFYTYLYTMSYCLQACAQNGTKFVVLDRPNPVNGTAVEGNILDTGFASFVGLHPIPIRHGFTVGEAAQFFNGELGFGADLEVVPCQGWKRAMYYDETGLPWIMPSPNLPTMDAAVLYTGLCYMEGTNVSEARGTSKPFEMVGAPFIDGYKLADRLNSLELPGVRFRPTSFYPSLSKHKEAQCFGVQAHVTDRGKLQTVPLGLHLVKALRDLFPKDFQFRAPGASGKRYFDLLLGTDKVREGIESGASVEEIMLPWRSGLEEFMVKRRPYLLYM